MWRSLREYGSAVSRKWWAIIGFGIAVLGLASGVSGKTILLPYWAWLIIGLTALMVAQFLVYYEIRRQRDPIESAVSELESSIISLGGQSTNMANLLWRLGHLFLTGIDPDSIYPTLRAIYQGSCSDECVRMVSKLRALQLVRDEQRWHRTTGYTRTIMTSLGASVLRELAKKWGDSPWPPSAV